MNEMLRLKLEQAIGRNDVQEVERIAADSADTLSAPDKNGRTLAHVAANGHVECLRFIAQRARETIGAAMLNGQTPAHVAAGSFGDKGEDCLRLIAQYGRDLLATPDNGGNTPAHEAARGNPRSLRVIADFAPRSLGAVANDRLTPATIAERWGSIECLCLIAKVARGSLTEAQRQMVSRAESASSSQSSSSPDAQRRNMVPTLRIGMTRKDVEAALGPASEIGDPDIASELSSAAVMEMADMMFEVAQRDPSADDNSGVLIWHRPEGRYKLSFFGDTLVAIVSAPERTSSGGNVSPTAARPAAAPVPTVHVTTMHPVNMGPACTSRATEPPAAAPAAKVPPANVPPATVPTLKEPSANAIRAKASSSEKALCLYLMALAISFVVHVIALMSESYMIANASRVILAMLSCGALVWLTAAMILAARRSPAATSGAEKNATRDNAEGNAGGPSRRETGQGKPGCVQGSGGGTPGARNSGQQQRGCVSKMEYLGMDDMNLLIALGQRTRDPKSLSHGEAMRAAEALECMFATCGTTKSASLMAAMAATQLMQCAFSDVQQTVMGIMKKNVDTVERGLGYLVDRLEQSRDQNR